MDDDAPLLGALGIAGRVLVSTLSWLADLSLLAWWSRWRQDHLLPGVTPATYGRKQHRVTRWLQRVGATQVRIALALLPVSLLGFAAWIALA